MKKLTIAGLVTALLIVALCATLVVCENYSHSHHTGRHMPFSLQIEVKAMTENSGFYNVYVTINASYEETINKIQLNKDIADLTTYINGTKVDAANSLQVEMNGGDLIEVNFTMPCSEYSSVNELKVFSTDATYGLSMPTSFQPYLITSLGWYLHNSSDPVTGMANKFTIYGSIVNTGVTTARNCSLVIDFYNNEELLQSSNVQIGDISGMFYNAFLNSTNVPVCAADSVTRTEVHLKGDNLPNA